MKFDEYVQHDAVGLAGLVRRKEVSATELLDAAIARTDEVNSELNAIVIRHDDVARAAIADGLPNGPLSGVPFLVKDLFIDLEGTTTSSGSVFLKQSVAKADSTAAARYKRAGLVIFGKTHSPELGGGPTTETRLFGITHNPWNLGVTASGSSGGAAAAVAAGITPIANGSDAGGSIRLPAAFNGLFGMKPTRGRVPLGPSRYDGGGGISTLHALTRSVRDSAALLDAAAGVEPAALYAAPTQRRPFVEAAAEDPRPLRIALNMVGISDGVQLDPQCAEAARNAARKCEALGHQVVEATPTVDAAMFMRARRALWASVVAGAVQGVQRVQDRKASREDFEPSTWQLYEEGLKVRGDEVLSARETMFTVHKAIVAFMKDYDVILSPPSQAQAPRPGTISTQQISEGAFREIDRHVAYTFLYNFTGQPAMAVPLYWTPDTGMPIGAQFAGAFGDEDLLFQLAGQLERAHPWFLKLPPHPFRSF